MDKEYQMVTVYQYLDLLEKKAPNIETKIKNAAGKYLHESNKASRNAIVLEKMVG